MRTNFGSQTNKKRLETYILDSSLLRKTPELMFPDSIYIASQIAEKTCRNNNYEQVKKLLKCHIKQNCRFFQNIFKPRFGFQTLKIFSTLNYLILERY